MFLRLYIDDLRACLEVCFYELSLNPLQFKRQFIIDICLLHDRKLCLTKRVTQKNSCPTWLHTLCADSQDIGNV